MEDADIDLAVKSIIASRVINTGQVCNCAERVYVDKKIKDAFIEKLVTGMKQVKVGNPNEVADGTTDRSKCPGCHGAKS